MEGVEQASQPSFTVAHQKVELDIDFSQQVRGKTEITIYPGSPDLRVFGLNARQCQLSSILINGLAPGTVTHRDPCDELALHFDNSNVYQHHLLSSRIDSTRQAIPEPNLIVTLPKTLRIQEVDIAEVHTQNAGVIKISHPEAQGADAAETTQGLTDTSIAKYTPLTVVIEFSTAHLPEAVQFVTGKRGTGRWPHAYTRGNGGGANASALFPCVDSLHARCTWDISITCPRTVGDAINQSLFFEGLTLEDKHRERAAYENKEMLILCSGKLNEESIYKTDSTKKTASFSIAQQLSAQQLGFAVGPFEKVSLNSFRDADDIAKLGENAVNMIGYSLPGRSEEVKNTCLATPKAVDMFVQKYIACPTHTFAMCFVEDLPHDVSVFAGASICSTRLLYPEDVIDPAQEITRKLVHAIASQWSGINIIPESPVDMWVTVGMAHYMTDLFMRELCGNNEYRYRIRKQADRIFDVDRERPSLYETGKYLHVDRSLYEFLCLKAPIVLFILDRRIHKSAGASKMPGIIAKILTRARTGDLLNNAVSTDLFQRTVERFYHASIVEFVDQWVMKSGCPRFRAYQRFNKKKLVVEMSITQVSSTLEKELDPHAFVRDVREEWEGVYAGEQKSVFTGPMTIRIHEADGTPYEHIVQIKESKTVIEVPYNTKYKRLKRSKRQRTKPSARNAEAGEEDNDSLVYCLGDTLQSEEEIRDWRITEWSAEDEERMNAESYEWIRLDADFEWIARIELQMPGYMYTSQVQQDRDVVAQLEAVKAIGGYPAQPLVSSILIRTLMDKRYFHAVRYIAAQGLVKHATDDNEANWIGLFHLKKAFEELFCNTDGGSAMTKPNDFADQQNYMVQTAIVEAISKVRDKQGHTPMDVKEWLLDKLKFNDNSNNEFSDAYYINKLMHALTNAIIARRTQASIGEDDMDLDIADELDKNRKIEQSCLDEIDRYRRMDEWTSSYQNLYSRSALQCQAKLMDAGIGVFSPLHFLQYTRPGNYEVLRGVAFEVLVRPDILDAEDRNGKGVVLRYIVHCMVGDSSPWIRGLLQRLMGVALARRAIGGPTSTSNAASTTMGLQAPEQNDSLVIEGVEAQDSKEMDIARRQNVEAALEALKKEIGSKNEALKTALWAAVNCADITLEDLGVMLDFCGMLYEPKYELKLSLRYPRYYQVRNLGKVCSLKLMCCRGWRLIDLQGKLHFSLTDKVRTKKMEKWEPPKPSAPLNVVPPPPQPRASQSGTTLKLKLGSSVSRTPSTSQSQYSVQPPPKKQKTESPRTSAKTSGRSTPMPEAKQQSPPAQPSQRITLKLSRPNASSN